MTNDLKFIHDQAREDNIPIMKDDGLSFLLEYIRNHENIRDILECGTAVGYSSMNMANIRWDMQIDTIEVDPQMFKQAIRNIEDQHLEDRIHCHLCDAADFEIDKKYDLIFIDAAKSQYRRYLEHFLKNALPGTVFVFDNLQFHGIVDDPQLSHNRSTLQMTRKIKSFRDKLLQDKRFDTTYYPDTGDGIAVAVVK